MTLRDYLQIVITILSLQSSTHNYANLLRQRTKQLVQSTQTLRNLHPGPDGAFPNLQTTTVLCDFASVSEQYYTDQNVPQVLVRSGVWLMMYWPACRNILAKLIFLYRNTMLYHGEDHDGVYHPFHHIATPQKRSTCQEAILKRKAWSQNCCCTSPLTLLRHMPCGNVWNQVPFCSGAIHAVLQVEQHRLSAALRGGTDLLKLYKKFCSTFSNA